MIFIRTTLLTYIFASCAICSACRAEQQEPTGNFKNPAAVKEVLSGNRTVANAAWWGFDEEDSTEALQGAINSGASKVIVPYMGGDWIVKPIKLASNQEIVFEPGVVVVAKKGEFSGKNDCLFSANGKKNITLRGYGATLRMRRNDYIKPPYPKSEWRMALALYCSSDIKVFGLTLKDSGGDGIFLGALKKGTPCRNVVIKDCICDNNYRQAMSVISAENLLVENCVFKNTNGTAPSSGIDIEPDVESDKLVNVIINDCISENNAGSGMQIYLRKLTAKSDDVSILFVNCHILRCGKSGIIAGGVSDDGPKGLIEFRNCVAEDLNSPGLYIFDKSPDGADLRFDSCKWANVAKLKTTSYLNNPVNSSPIHFFLRRREVARRFGGVSFVNCYVYDDKDRPFLTATEQGQGVYDIEGDFNIYNPFGAKENLGKKNESIKLQIRNQYQRNK